MTAYVTPGVYIDEVTGPGVIAGIGTSTVAFVGPALAGPMNVPTLITSWDDFVATFGAPTGRSPTPNVYIPPVPTNPGTRKFYMAYAVRGFFDNGGQVAYVVRIGNAAAASATVADSWGGAAFTIQAVQEGTTSNSISLTLQQAHSPTHVLVLTGSASLLDPAAVSPGAPAPTQWLFISANDKSKFRPGDPVIVQPWTHGNTISMISPVPSATPGSLPNYYKLQLTNPLPTGYVFASGQTVQIGTSLAGGVPQLGPGARAFRVNGAGLYVGSVVQLGSETPPEIATVASTIQGPDYWVTLETDLAQSHPLTNAGVGALTLTAQEFDLVITAGAPTASYFNLATDPRHPRYYVTVLDSVVPAPPIRLIPPDIHDTPPNDLPAWGATPASIQLTLGSSTSTPAGAVSSYVVGALDNLAQIGVVELQNGLDALTRVHDVDIVCAPDYQDPGDQLSLVVAHCVAMKDRFAILDSQKTEGNPKTLDLQSVLQHRQSVQSPSGFAALYYPWILVNDPDPNASASTLLVPPSGHIAGIYARVDQQRGVHKAPANEPVVGALALQRPISAQEQGVLNPEGINAIRILPGGGPPTVWGARTTVATDITDWIYVNVRRLLLYIEGSIEQGIQWAVFEPNNPALWQKLKRVITEFLTRLWRQGALVGDTAAQAFYVRVDSTINPVPEQKLGRLHIEIGVAPAYPAEFIIVRIGLWDGGASLIES